MFKPTASSVALLTLISASPFVAARPAPPLAVAEQFADKVAKDDNEKNEKKIEVKDLPAAVVDALTKAMPDGKISNAETETKDGKTVYEVDVKVGDKTWEVSVSEEGKILSKKEESKEEEKKEEGK